MKVMVKSDSKSSNDALKGTMAQIKGEDYTDLQVDAPRYQGDKYDNGESGCDRES